MKKQAVAAVASLMLLASMTGCASFKHTSCWKDKSVTIDGVDTEWQGRMLQYGSIFLGACNDNDFLYLCLNTTNKDIRSQLMGMRGQSFTVWFDPAGKTGKALGIRFSYDPPAKQAGGRNEPPALGQRTEQGAQPDNQRQPASETARKPSKIEVLENGEVVAQITDAPGIEAVLSTMRDGKKAVCEMKIPLQAGASATYALQAISGKPVGITLEASKIENKEMQEGPGGSGGSGPGGTPPSGGNDSSFGGGPGGQGGPGGGFGGGPGGQGGPGGGPGGRGGPGGQNGTASTEAFKMNGTIILAVQG